MNFEKIPPVKTSVDIIDVAFRQARVKGRQRNLKGNWLQIIRKKESLKLDVIKDSLEFSLQKIITSFPNLQQLPTFYQKLMDITLEISKFKQALGSLAWVVKKNRELHRLFVSKINHEPDRLKITRLSKEYYGRIGSILQQTNSNLDYLEHCRKVMRLYPDIKERFTVCIYGFPNVGKTTLLNQLTKTKAKVAIYPFTTKSINVGYFTVNGQEIQVLDVPGTLAREKLNLIEKQAQLAISELADIVIYVMDATESCGYSFKKQQQLLNQLKTELTDKKIFVYYSKIDVMPPEDLIKIDKIDTVEEIKKEIGKRV